MHGCAYMHACLHACVSVYALFLIVSCIHTQPPIEKVLGQDFRLTPSGAMREVKDCFYYIPLLSSLQAMLKHKEIRDQVNIIIKGSIAIRSYISGLAFYPDFSCNCVAS